MNMPLSRFTKTILKVMLVKVVVCCLLSSAAFALGHALPDSGQLIFRSELEGRGEIYVIDVGRGLLFNLTNSRRHESSPAWSPDGAQIAFVTFFSDVYVMDADGRNRRQLAHLGDTGGPPTWSPDGQRIAMQWDGSIYAVEVFSGERLPLAGQSWTNGSYKWSSDGSQLVFERAGDIYLVDSSGERLQRLTQGDEFDQSPVSSPHGRYIAFVTFNRRARTTSVTIVNHDGSEPRRLTYAEVVHGRLAWSPNGEQLVFQRGADLYVTDADANEVRRLTAGDGTNWWPAWSPDGKMVAFVSNRDGDAEIYVMNADGGNVRQLTFNHVNDHEPMWRP